MAIMTKVKFVVLIIGLTILAYIMLTAMMPAINSITSNASGAANYTAYEGTQAALDSAPWWLYMLPGVIAGISIIITLRAK